MRIHKRLLSLFLTVAMMLTMFPLTNIVVSASYTGAFEFNSSGKFRVMSLNDIQDGSNVNSRVIAMITNAIARYKPDLVVFIGDNVTGGLSESAFKSSASQFLQPLLDSNTKYAVTFGNHDDEGAINKTDQYAYYISHGGNNAVDHDVEPLTGVGSGLIPIYPNGQTSGAPAFQVYLMDSGTYAPGGGYDCPYTNQIDYYIQRSIQYPNVPSLWYQHIIVPDVYAKCMTTIYNSTKVSFFGNGKPFSGKLYWLQPSRINWAKSGVATTVKEIYKEGPCPANLSTYESTEHRSSPTYGSKTLYESWVAYGNMLGTYYGHDHKNSFVSTTADGIDIGFSKGATLNSYNDGNPGFRIYDLDVNGTYSSYNVTEADLTKAQIFFDANGGAGEMIPQFISKNSTAAIKSNTYTKPGRPFLGWATSPTGNVAYQNTSNFSIGTNDVTLYAKWDVTSNITFHANGGIGGTEPTAMEVGTALVAPNVSQTGYAFSGWSPPLPSTVPSIDTTYIAQWNAIEYTMTFDINGGTGTAPSPQTGHFNASLLLPDQGDIVKQGFDFLGWALTPGATQPLTDFSFPANDATLYAAWVALPQLVAQPGATTVVDSTENLIYGLKAGITREEFEDDFITLTGNAKLVVTPTTQGFGTGTKVEVVDKVSQNVIQTFIIIIFGDVNGDGNIDSMDAGVLVDIENYKTVWNPVTDAIFIKAGDLNGDGNFDSVDAGIIADEANYKSILDQATGLVKI